MKFQFDKPTCQNIRKSLRKEWLETNGLGDYASSSLLCCNTRKYHGLLVADLAEPAGRHVLLSALEESLLINGKEFCISCRKHPGVYHPRGHEYLEQMSAGPWPTFTYRFGELHLRREPILVQGRRLLIIRYSLTGVAPDTPPMTLRLRPLLAFRNAHATTHANDALRGDVMPLTCGVSIRPYPDLPRLSMQIQGGGSGFSAAPDWCRNVEYMIEAERGFPNQEDLFQPGWFDVEVNREEPVYFAATTEERFVVTSGGSELADLWSGETGRRMGNGKDVESLEDHLAHEGGKFLVRTPLGPRVVAGYHWFGAWGRDTFIALPGLTFHAGRDTEGRELLASLGATARDGLIPNCFSPDGRHAYNSIDASLWYVWAVQQMMMKYRTEGRTEEAMHFVHEHCWPVIKSIISSYRAGAGGLLHFDDEGFFNVGAPDTQLTWMDAIADGRPVTPRHGQPVEIVALWYNALACAGALGEMFKEPEWSCRDQLLRMRTVFSHRYWITDVRGDYLADLWRDGEIDRSVRPNQIFAVSLPYAILEEAKRPEVVSRVQRCLLTPFGIRTLAPSSPLYRPLYEGGPSHRDGAYHQGTVWPWLLGAYGDALMKVAWEVPTSVRELLATLRPLFAQHLGDAGMGSISEIFDGDPPHQPNGCVAQAWSVAECLRLLRTLKRAAPEVYEPWEADARKGGR